MRHRIAVLVLVAAAGACGQGRIVRESVVSAFPNLVSLLLLSPVIAKVTADYFASGGAD